MASLILTLDLGTKTGFAILDRDGKVHSGTMNFKQDRFAGGGMRYLRFTEWLDSIQQSFVMVDEVYYESVRSHKGTDAAHAYGGFMACLTSWCEQHKIPYQGIPVGTIKKQATGKGNVSKEAVMAAMSDRFKGQTIADDNQADALAILDYAISEHTRILKGC